MFVYLHSPIGFYATITFLTSVYAGVLFAYLIVMILMQCAVLLNYSLCFLS